MSKLFGWLNKKKPEEKPQNDVPATEPADVPADITPDADAPVEPDTAQPLSEPEASSSSAPADEPLSYPAHRAAYVDDAAALRRLTAGWAPEDWASSLERSAHEFLNEEISTNWRQHRY